MSFQRRFLNEEIDEEIHGPASGLVLPCRVLRAHPHANSGPDGDSGSANGYVRAPDCDTCAANGDIRTADRNTCPTNGNGDSHSADGHTCATDGHLYRRAAHTNGDAGPCHRHAETAYGHP